MKKKGFTLIELLAVIIVLAIIALIATPIVMNVIKNVQKGAAERSAERYLDAVKLTIATKQLDGERILDGEYIITSDGSFNGNGKSYKVEISGSAPTAGRLLIENEEVIEKSFSSNGYYLYYQDGKMQSLKIDQGVTVTGLNNEDGTPIVYTTWQNAYNAFNDKYYQNLDKTNYTSDTVKTDILPDNMVWTFYGDVPVYNNDNIENSSGTVDYLLSGDYHGDETPGNAQLNQQKLIYEHDIESIYLVAGSNDSTVQMTYNTELATNKVVGKFFSYKYAEGQSLYPTNEKASPNINVSGLYFDGYRMMFDNSGSIAFNECYFNGELSISIGETAPTEISITNSVFEYKEPSNAIITTRTGDAQKYAIFVSRYATSGSIVPQMPTSVKIENNTIKHYNRGINVDIIYDQNSENINNAVVQIVNNTITDIDVRDSSEAEREAIQLANATQVLIEGNTISDVAGNVLTLYKGYNAPVTTIKNNKFTANYLIWNDNDYTPYISSANNTFDIKYTNKAITKTGEVIDSNITINNKVCLAIVGDGTQIGNEVKCGTEEFYVISKDATELTDATLTDSIALMKKTNLDIGNVAFSSTNYWKDYVTDYLYVYNEQSNLYSHVQDYKNYLSSTVGVNVQEVKLPTFSHLVKLGCTWGGNCSKAPAWVYSTSYFTGSANGPGGLHIVRENNTQIKYVAYNVANVGTRPVVILPKSELGL